jgi:hypothetical protein
MAPWPTRLWHHEMLFQPPTSATSFIKELDTLGGQPSYGESTVGVLTWALRVKGGEVVGPPTSYAHPYPPYTLQNL